MNNGKTAIVTGGTRGIGFRVVCGLLDKGYTVAFCSRSAEDCANVTEELRRLYPDANCFGMACDLRSEEAIGSFCSLVLAKTGRLDVAVNCAGIGFFEPCEALSHRSLTEMAEVNYLGTAAMCRFCLPLMLKNTTSPRGIILNVGSTAEDSYVPGDAGYAASKAALRSFSEYLFNEYRERDIAVTHLTLGSVRTDFSKRHSANAEWKIAPEDAAKAILTAIGFAEACPTGVLSHLVVRTKHPIKTEQNKE